MSDPPFAKRGSGKRAPEERVYGLGTMGEELGTHEPGGRGRPKSKRQVQRYKKDGKLAFTQKRCIKDWGPLLNSSITQSLWAAGEGIDIAVGSAHAAAAQKPRPNRKKRSSMEVDAPPGGGTSATDITEIPEK